MAAIGFIYAWQKLYPVLIFRSVLLTVRKCDLDRQFLSHSYLLNFSSNFTMVNNDVNEEL